MSTIKERLLVKAASPDPQVAATFTGFARLYSDYRAGCTPKAEHLRLLREHCLSAGIKYTSLESALNKVSR